MLKVSDAKLKLTSEERKSTIGRAAVTVTVSFNCRPVTNSILVSLPSSTTAARVAVAWMPSTVTVYSPGGRYSN